MKLIILFGPPAVGKMTVGYEIEKITGCKLFHNHMTLELIMPFFEFGSPSFLKLIRSIRLQLFEEVANSSLKGLIFTYVWSLDDPSNWEFIDSIVDIFKKKGADIYYVELEAELEERLKRNTSSFRLLKKESKRDTVQSQQRLLSLEKKHVFNTGRIRLEHKNYVKINNTNLSPKETALRIKKALQI